MTAFVQELRRTDLFKLPGVAEKADVGLSAQSAFQRERLVAAGEHREPERAGGVDPERQDAPLVGEHLGVEELDAGAGDAHAVVVDDGLAFALRGLQQSLLPLCRWQFFQCREFSFGSLRSQRRWLRKNGKREYQDHC